MPIQILTEVYVTLYDLQVWGNWSKKLIEFTEEQ